MARHFLVASKCFLGPLVKTIFLGWKSKAKCILMGISIIPVSLKYFFVWFHQSYPLTSLSDLMKNDCTFCLNKTWLVYLWFHYLSLQFQCANRSYHILYSTLLHHSSSWLKHVKHIWKGIHFKSKTHLNRPWELCL